MANVANELDHILITKLNGYFPYINTQQDYSIALY